MKHIVCVLVFGVGALCSVMAQSVPAWVQSPPPRTSTYYYRVAHGTGLTGEAAERQAFAMAIMESAFAIGVPVDVKRLEQMESDSLLVEVSRYVRIPINKVCVHVESLVTRRGYRAYVLCQVANDPRIAPNFKSFNCLKNKEE